MSLVDSGADKSLPPSVQSPFVVSLGRKGKNWKNKNKFEMKNKIIYKNENSQMPRRRLECYLKNPIYYLFLTLVFFLSPGSTG